MIIKFIRNKVLSGKERSVKAKKNIIGSLAIRIASIAISFLMVPLTLEYVNPTQYGIWLTLSTIVGWFSFFDIGLTHGLRNKLAVAKAEGKSADARMYVSTTYAILGIIFFSVWVIFIIIHQFLDWSVLLNADSEMKAEVSLLAVIVFTYFCLQFILKIVNTVIIADQQPAKASFIDLFTQLLSLIIIIVLVKTTEGSLINLGLALCVSPVIVYILSNSFFYNRTYKEYKPKLSQVNFRQSKGLLNLGLKFFIIQIAGLIQYQSANFIIAQNFGTYDVTSYNIVYKYFGMLTMGLGILLGPFWTASTDAYHKNDINWIKNSVKKYLLVVIALLLIGFIMLIFSEKFYQVWLKGKVEIEFVLSMWGFIFVAFYGFGNIFVNFLNGISALRIQFWSCLFSPLLYIAIAFILIKFSDLGVSSLFVAALIASFNGWFIAPIQYYLIIYKNRGGIWIK